MASGFVVSVRSLSWLIPMSSDGEVVSTSGESDSPVGEDHIERAVEIAVATRQLSYAPYSQFLMGAGIVGHDGREVRGALVENVSLGLAMCSERVALFNAVAEDLSPAVLAVSSERTDGELTFPCGACLQVALEIAGPDLVVVAVDTDGQRATSVLRSLLPRAPHRYTPRTAPDQPSR